MHEFDVPIQCRYYKVVLSLAEHFQLSIVALDSQAIVATEIKTFIYENSAIFFLT